MAKSSGGGGVGFFGFAGTTIQCPASDTSYYCNFIKIFNVFMIVCFILFILYTIYNFVMPNYFGKKRR